MINKEINDFSVQAYQNGEFKNHKLKRYHERMESLFFYPADFTFVCPTELEDLQNKYSEFLKAGCEVYSVSTDSHFIAQSMARLTLSELVRSHTQCWPIPLMYYVRTLGY